MAASDSTSTVNSGARFSPPPASRSASFDFPNNQQAMHIKNQPSILAAAAIAIAALTAPNGPAAPMPQPSFHTKGSPTGRPKGPLKPGEYWWNPRVSPQGPVVLLVSLPLQTMHVYRNGILVGRSSVSTGSPGHQTPTGVFTILEKKQTHRSKKYDNAPMPNMQRLTWSGICMHSGNLPGYPASHGCIRMPYDFSTMLFGITGGGGTVVIGDNTKVQPHFAANPGVLLAPKDLRPGTLKPLASGGYEWKPERSTQGPITIMVSAGDKTVYVYRNGEIIGRAAIEVSGHLGGHVFTLLEGVSGSASPWAPGRPGRKWMRVQSDAATSKADAGELAKRVRISPEFAGKLYDAVAPGATIIITDAPAVRKASRDFTILAD
jgi:lipoprotein-anchoring transpeptidase ErfK/SrfK